MAQRASYMQSMQNPVQDQKNGEESFELIDAPNQAQMSWLINGEILQQHEPDSVVATPKGNVHGDLFVTNYRLKFVPHDTNGADKDIMEFDFPLGLINSVKKFGYSSNLDPRAIRAGGGEQSYGIKVACKDLRNLKFVHKKERHNRRALFETLVINAFPNTNNRPFFAELYKQPFKINGWTLFDPIQEFKRMNVPNDVWVVSDINENYEFVDTYPKILGFPKEAYDKGREFLDKVGSFRSSKRLPVLSWYNPQTSVAILRSSQPMTGVLLFSSSADKAYLEMIYKANPGSKNLKIFDARPIQNAEVNRLRGGGYERSYPHCKLIFLNIHSIHAIRKSLRAFKAIYYPKKSLIGIGGSSSKPPENSEWVSHLQSILNGTHKIVTEICDEKTSCLIHCSDGWDRTSQLCSLTMLLLDHHYRTLEGFAILIEKEWLSFGHKFAIRFGHGKNEPKQKERSPIFIQWLDCVWQYYNEFPTAFEFNVELLMTLLDEVYSCRFGTFLFNNEREREVAKLKQNTTSIWSYVLENREMYTNPKFSPVYAPLRTEQALKVKIWIDYYCRHTWEMTMTDDNSSSSSSESDFQQLTPSRVAPPPPNRSEVTKF